MIRIIENKMKEPITITCGECHSIFTFEFTDIQRVEENSLCFPIGITKVRRYVICPVCKADLVYKAPQHLYGTSCGQIVLDENVPASGGED